MKKIIFALLTIALATTGVKAQQAITIVGGGVSNSNGSISQSAGEVAVRRSVAKAITVVNITQYFTEGVQQTYADGRESIVAPLPVKLNVGPNPTRDWVDVYVADAIDFTSLNFTLYNIKGETIKSSKLESEKTHIDLATLPAGTYLLHIEKENHSERNVYKIIKAN